MCWMLDCRRTCTFSVREKFLRFANTSKCICSFIIFLGDLSYLEAYKSSFHVFYFHQICCYLSVPYFKLLRHLSNYQLRVAANLYRSFLSLAARPRPMITASYSISFFVARNSKLTSIPTLWSPTYHYDPYSRSLSVRGLIHKFSNSLFCPIDCSGGL